MSSAAAIFERNASSVSSPIRTEKGPNKDIASSDMGPFMGSLYHSGQASHRSSEVFAEDDPLTFF
jgi:hypothetical protein